MQQKISLSSDQSKKISAAVTGNLGRYYDGSYQSVVVTCNFAPVPYIFISPNIEVGRLKKVGINHTTKDVTLYTVEGRVALNPRLQLSGIFQRSNVTNTVSWNTRFSWEFRPLSYFYFVFNSNSAAQTLKTEDRQVITKLSYLKQF